MTRKLRRVRSLLVRRRRLNSRTLIVRAARSITTMPFAVKKVLTGRSWTDNDAFRFIPPPRPTTPRCRLARMASLMACPYQAGPGPGRRLCGWHVRQYHLHEARYVRLRNRRGSERGRRSWHVLVAGALSRGRHGDRRACGAGRRCHPSGLIECRASWCKSPMTTARASSPMTASTPQRSPTNSPRGKRSGIPR